MVRVVSQAVLMLHHCQLMVHTSKLVLEASDVELTLWQMVMRMGYQKYR
jgi:hypothetical protein